MVQPLTSPSQRGLQQSAQAPLSILRTETVLSRFPIHHLTTRGSVTISIRRTGSEPTWWRNGTAAVALPLAIRTAVDAVLDDRAGVAARPRRRAAQTTPCAVVSGDGGAATPADGGAYDAA